ncbi:ribosome biogenesis GTP-binding protein YihA/YsxC [Prevotella lacticifex]|jgi:GTP-binding protein|uniref:Probable GTP-binding protein EngB n=1 Tax=Prevotella lacticifex TaxID=2854755 RepID=A0A9R1CX52_9BACT|nr:ribosome biogenesis GTP-binding protein YihA/YsxC [Prevotella lacticifex]GJG35879.1 putative GTP-binding protein EngB [Prevotella lacticifex]GJG39072.1 putative GTP-binding protein EngB [Prevotella lacticifex]GJG42248.1 putative GTP-binding protein EngB [Prevotella lacticifex]GJG45426.1 putative GTP-binding protein EngB [Prevotella lacticifex]GJG48599.1 putative GTP-binding protein EngB [Prevotella lacticifex]
MIINKSEFVISAPSVERCPDDNKPEYAFIGRSNVGKSSLINMLCQHKGLAKTSATPGKTLLINHFLINDEWYIVDLPGYGYARSKTTQSKLQIMNTGYILKRQQLCCLFVLIDIRHEQKDIDRRFVDWLGENGIPFAIVFTKADKLTQSRAFSNATKWMNTLKDTWENLPPFFITSAANRKGREELLNYIEEINNNVKEQEQE